MADRLQLRIKRRVDCFMAAWWVLDDCLPGVEGLIFGCFMVALRLLGGCIVQLAKLRPANVYAFGDNALLPFS